MCVWYVVCLVWSKFGIYFATLQANWWCSFWMEMYKMMLPWDCEMAKGDRFCQCNWIRSNNVRIEHTMCDKHESNLWQSDIMFCIRCNFICIFIYLNSIQRWEFVDDLFMVKYCIINGQGQLSIAPHQMINIFKLNAFNTGSVVFTCMFTVQSITITTTHFALPLSFCSRNCVRIYFSIYLPQSVTWQWIRGIFLSTR